MLELRNITKTFGKETVLDALNLTITAGSRTAIVGPSGSGKTTLLRIIAGFDMPDSGTLTLHGQALFDASRSVPAHLRNIGYVPQEGALFPHLRVGENIAFGLKGGLRENRRQVASLMERVSLDLRLQNHWPHEISGGQQQRVALARALAQKPTLMLLDEPFSALDTGLRAATRKATAETLAQAGVASILVTHDQHEALSFASQVAVMRRGRFAQVGSPAEVYSRPVDEETALFLGDALILPAQFAAGQASCALGVFPAETTLTTGQVMLRPEQIALRAGGPLTVSEVDFAGYTSRLTLTCDALAQPFTLQVASNPLWQPGTTVSVSVQGPLHILN